jgi:hypothetical protein
MKRKIELICVVAIAMALMIVLSSGVALASYRVKPTSQTETIKTTTEIACDKTVIESAELNWECSSKNLDNMFQSGEKQGQIKYNENMIGSDGATEFNKEFKVNTGKKPNLVVTKNIEYASGELGSLSHDEVVGMSLISTKSCGYVAAESSMTVTEVLATTETKAWITSAPKLHYEIDAEGAGDVTAGMHAFVEEGRYKKPVSKLKLDDKSTASGLFEFHKSIYCKP